MKGMKRRLATLLAVALVAGTISFPGYAEPEDEIVYEDTELGSYDATSESRSGLRNQSIKASPSDAVFEVNGEELEGNTLTMTEGEDVWVEFASPSNAGIISASPSDATKVSVTETATDSNAMKVQAKKATTAGDPVKVKVTYVNLDDEPQSQYTAEFSVVVNKKETGEAAISLDLEKAELISGETTTIEVKASPSDASIADLTASPSNAAVTVTPRSGEDIIDVTANSVDTDTQVIVKVTAQVNGKEVTKSVELTVKPEAVEPEVPKVKSIVITADKDINTLYAYQNLTVTAKVTPEDAEGTIKFSTSDPDILVLDPSGNEVQIVNGIATAKFIAIRTGTADIKATDGLGSVTSNTLNVKTQRARASLTFKDTAIAMKPDEQKVVTVDSVTLNNIVDEELLAQVKQGIRYTSSDPSVATVDSITGNVKAIKEGSAIVKAYSDYARGEASYTVVVAQGAVHQITFIDASSFKLLQTDAIKKINYIVTEVKDDGTATDVTKQVGASWKSSNTSVVTVDKNGIISTRAAGTADITLTIANADGKVLGYSVLSVVVTKPSTIPEETVTEYKKDENVSKVLSGEAVTAEQVKAASTAIGAAIGGLQSSELINSGAIGTVMSDISKIEKLLGEKEIVAETKPNVTTSKISGNIEVAGLMLNGYLEDPSAPQAPQLTVADLSAGAAVVPEEVGGRQIEKTLGLDISVDVSITVPVRVRIPLPAGYTNSNTMLLHYEDGDAESASIVPCTVSGGVLEFTVGSFSPFVIVQTTGGGNNNNNSSGGGSSTFTKTAEAGKWIQNETGWWYRYNNGTWPVNEWVSLSYSGITNWYHFDQNGYMQSGWFQDTDGRKYYLNPVSNGTRGAMLTGWQMIDGNWYYFNTVSDGSRGSLFVNTTTPDNYKVNENGVWVQ